MAIEKKKFEKKIGLEIRCKRAKLEQAIDSAWNELTSNIGDNENPIIVVPIAGLSREFKTRDDISRSVKCDCGVRDCWFVKINFID